MDKRGISPLVATVLIIGFVVLLAAILISWQMGFVNEFKSNVDKSTFKSMRCSSDVGLNIKSACLEGGLGVRVSLENYGDIDIESFNVRLIGDLGGESYLFETGLVANNIDRINLGFDSATVGSLTSVELIPNVMSGSQVVTCDNVIEKESDFSGCTVSELQEVACEQADTAGTCSKLVDIGLITEEECCDLLDYCCP